MHKSRARPECANGCILLSVDVSKMKMEKLFSRGRRSSYLKTLVMNHPFWWGHQRS